MFNRREKNEEPKKKGRLDKLIMGAIIGTAIGSVIGMAVAPKKGEETRQYLKDKYKNRNELLPTDEIKEIKKLTKETVTGVGTLIKNFILRRKNHVTPAQNSAEDPVQNARTHNDLKKIPRETEVENTFDHSQD